MPHPAARLPRPPRHANMHWEHFNESRVPDLAGSGFTGGTGKGGSPVEEVLEVGEKEEAAVRVIALLWQLEPRVRDVIPAEAPCLPWGFIRVAPWGAAVHRGLLLPLNLKV